MSLAKRRLLFYFFIFLFAVIVPVILLYATGNSVNWQRLELEKTAGIIIDSDPAGATLTLNGETPGSLARQFFGQAPDPHTKTKISGLKPGDYVLRLELDGYAPWEEKISLQPGQVHNTGTIELFQKNSAQLVTALPPSTNFSLSADEKLLATFAGTTITITSLSEGTTQSIETSQEATNKEMSWSPDGRFLLIGQALLYDRQAASLTDINTVFGIKASIIRWAADGQLWAIEGSNLWRLDPIEKLKQMRLDITDQLGVMPVNDMHVENGRTMLLVAGNTPTLLIFDTTSPEREVRQTLPAGRYRFAADGQGNVLVQTIGGGPLYRLERPLPLLSSYRLAPIADHFQTGRWNDSELFYATPFELRHWSNGSDEILSRWGEAVAAIARIPQSDYYLFVASGSIYVRPASSQPFADSLLLLQPERFDTLIRISQHELYFTGRADGQDGLFRLAF